MRILLSASALLTAAIFPLVHAAPLYHDATPANTTLADGTPLSLQATVVAGDPPQAYSSSGTAETANGHWHYRTGFGNGGAIFASAAASDSAMLRTTVGGLAEGDSYDVFVAFWVAGNGVPTGNQEWDIRAGLDASATTPIRFNTAGVIRLDTSPLTFGNSVMRTEADRRLFMFPLGNVTVTASGEVQAYIDDLTGNDDRTWYDGLVLSPVAAPEPATWVGEGADALWTTAANWQSGSAPAAGEALRFVASTQTDAENNLPADRAYAGLTFTDDASSMFLRGNRLSLTAPLTIQSPGVQTFELGLLLQETLDMNLLTGALYLDGVISGPGGISKSGSGTVEFTAANAYKGRTTIVSGPATVVADQTAADGGWDVGPNSAAFTTVAFTEDATIVTAAGGRIRIGDTKGSLAGSLTNQVLDSSGTVTNAGTLEMGLQSLLNLNAGTWTQSGPMLIRGYDNWNCRMTIGSAATFLHQGADRIQMRAGTGATGRARIIVDGGVLATGRGFENEDPTGAQQPFVELRNGGTLRLLDAVAELNPSVPISLAQGTAVIDTNGHSATVTGPWSGPGSLEKSGAGTLTLTGSQVHTGGTTVAAGTLALQQPALDATAAVEIATGASVSLGFSGSNPVAGLTLGGVVQPPGSYSAATHPAFISGTGSLVVPDPNLTGFAAWAAGLGLSGDPLADFDQDGMEDSLEYLFGTVPTASQPSPVSVTTTATHFIVSFPRSQDAAAATVCSVEFSSDLQSWPVSLTVGLDPASSSPGVTITPGAAGMEMVSVSVARSGGRQFARVRVATGL